MTHDNQPAGVAGGESVQHPSGPATPADATFGTGAVPATGSSEGIPPTPPVLEAPVAAPDGEQPQHYPPSQATVQGSIPPGLAQQVAVAPAVQVSPSWWTKKRIAWAAGISALALALTATASSLITQAVGHHGDRPGSGQFVGPGKGGLGGDGQGGPPSGGFGRDRGAAGSDSDANSRSGGSGQGSGSAPGLPGRPSNDQGAAGGSSGPDASSTPPDTESATPSDAS